MYFRGLNWLKISLTAFIVVIINKCVLLCLNIFFYVYGFYKFNILI